MRCDPGAQKGQAVKGPVGLRGRVSATLHEEDQPGSPEGRRGDRDVADGPDPDARLDILFRDLDEESEPVPGGPRRGTGGDREPGAADRRLAALWRPGPSRKGRAGRALLVLGVVLIVAGSVGALVIPTPELFLSFVLGAFILAVACIAVGILLLPEASARA